MEQIAATPRIPRAERAARLALGVTVLLAAAKVAAGLATGSLALLSQAADSVLDIVALVLVLVAVRLAHKPADRSHHFGHSKAENLVAYTETLFLGTFVAVVAVEAVARLRGPAAPVDAPGWAIGLLGVSVVVDAARAVYLLRVARAAGSDALHAGGLNIAADVGTAGVALSSLVLVRGGVPRADAVGALVVAGIVAIAGWRVGRRSVDVLMDSAPAGIGETIAAAAGGVAGVTEARRVRVRGEGGKLFADVTVAAGRTASLERAHDIAEAVERAVEAAVPGTDVVVHVEPSPEVAGLVEAARAAASRAEGVHEVHNVSVHTFDENGARRIHATLHAKVDHDLSLDEAHAVADRVEDSVRSELGADARVDAHIEPLQPAARSRDLTAQRRDIVAAVERIAGREPEVVDCHEVLVTSAEGRIRVTAHVRGKRTLPLAEIHDASERIEGRLRAAHPEIAEVLIHFEPEDESP